MYLFASHKNCGEKAPSESRAEWIALSTIFRLDTCIFPPLHRPKLHLIISFTWGFTLRLIKLCRNKDFLVNVRHQLNRG